MGVLIGRLGVKMSMNRTLAVAFALGASLLIGCANVPSRGGFAEVEEDVTERLGYEVSWQQGEAEDAAIRARVRELLADVLSPDSAVQIALLQNPDLQASYESLGVAQADLVAAGLLQNPVLVAAPRLGVGSLSGTNLEFDIAQNFLQLLTLGPRKEIADMQFDEARYRVSHRVLELASEVREAYYDLVAAQHLLTVLETTERAAAASSEYAKRLHAAGNISDLELAREQALYEETRVARDIAKAETGAPRERLIRLLGLDHELSFASPRSLPAVPREAVVGSGLEALAIGHRLDLRAIEMEIEAFKRALDLARLYRWIPFVEVGISAERETEGGWVVGPVLALEIPIFDQGQVQVARFESLLRQRKRERESLLLDIRRDVRIHRESLQAARALAGSYLQTVIPLQERIVQLTQQEFNFKLVGAFELLSAKRNEIAAYRDYVEALGRYWTSHAMLKGALGIAPPVMPVMPTSDMDPQHSEPAPHQHQSHQGHHGVEHGK
jgi:cobalt-zinc-cadmium efflux system outer membrane protein